MTATSEKDQIRIFDTTLRDGEQSPGASMTLEEKLQIAEILDDMGVDMDTDGHYLQLGYLFPNKKVEIAARMAEVSPDVVGASQDTTETGVAFSYYFDKHRYKLQADYRMLEFDIDPALDTDEARLQLQLQF